MIRKFKSEAEAKSYLRNILAQVSGNLGCRYDIAMGPDCKYSIAMIKNGELIGFVR